MKKTWKKILSVVMALALVLPLFLAFTATANTVNATANDWDTDGDGVLEILTIGNSFSNDLMIGHTGYLALDLGVEKIYFGNLYISGCPLSTHAANAKEDLAKYEYYTTETGKYSSVEGYKSGDALKSRSWDYVSLQESTGSIGQLKSYNENLIYMINYVNGILKDETNENRNPNFRLLWHMTWAVQQDCTHDTFAQYNKDQMTMYNQIAKVVREEIAPNDVFYAIIPSGTAIQNARTSLLGDNLTRDGYHLTKDKGRYILGLMLMKTLGFDVSKASYLPAGVTETCRRIAIESVENAAATPFAVTDSAYTADFSKDGYLVKDLTFSPCKAWVSTSATKFNVLNDSGNTFATDRLTRADIPVGSIIVVTDGWKYRPEGWVDPAAPETVRLDSVTDSSVEVTEEWWGDYTLRAFNVARTDNSSFEGIFESEMEYAFRILIPEAEHTYDGDCDAACNGCGAVREIQGHVYDNACDTTCNRCGAEREAHTYDDACDTTCNGCGAEREAHTYDNACDTTCNGCGTERQFAGHVYDNAVDTNCNACFAVRTLPYDSYGLTGDCFWHLEGTKLTVSGNGAMADYTTSNNALAKTSVTELVIEEGVTYVGTYSFEDCVALTTVTLPKSVTTIADRAFDGCNGLTDIWYEGSENERSQITVGSYNGWLNINGSKTAVWHYVDSICDTDCNVCDAVRMPPHTYDNYCDTDCNECGTVREAPNHVYNNACDTDCNVCGAEREVSDHVYDNACDATCNACWEVREIQGHVYDNACDTTCNRCGAEREAHTYDNACDTTCNVCGVERPVPGHVYDNDSDVSCNICGAEKILQGTTGACTWKLKGDVLTISGNGAMGVYSKASPAPWGTDFTTLIIERGVTTIGNYAFRNSALTTVAIPKSVTEVKERGFDGCSKIADVWYEGSESDKTNITFKGYNRYCSELSQWHYGACVNNMDGNWEHSYDNIVDDTCNLCSGTRTLDYDKYGDTGECFWYLEGTKLTIFGEGAMKNYTQKAPAPWGTSVTELVIEEGVTGVGSYAFSDCAGLTTAILPDSVKNTAIYSFYNCTNLKTVVISDSIVKISRYSFYNCIGITNVWYEGNESDRNAIEISGYNARLTDATWHYDCCMANPDVWTHDYNGETLICDKCEGKFEVDSKINLSVEERIYLNLWLNAADVDAYKALTGKDFTYSATLADRKLGEGTVTGAPVETEYGTYYIIRLDAVSANLFGEQILVDCPTGVINAVGDEALTMLSLAKGGIAQYQDQKVKDLFTALYNYGASVMGEAPLNMPADFVQNQEDDIQVTAKTNETASFQSVYLLMGDSIGIRLKGRLLGDENALSVKVNGNETNACKLNVGADGTLTIDLYVSADHFNTDLTIKVYSGEDVIASFIGSVKGYSEQIANQDAKTLALAQFVQACVNYKAA